MTKFQTRVLSKLSNKIKETCPGFKIEPSLNSDSELVLFRNTDKGLTNIIINPYEWFAFSFIPKNHNIKKSLTFYEEDYEDIQGLVNKFLTN